MEKKFVGIGEVVEVTLVDEQGLQRVTKITPIEMGENVGDPCLGCALDCEDACYAFSCCPPDREDGFNVIFVEVKNATDA